MELSSREAKSLDQGRECLEELATYLESMPAYNPNTPLQDWFQTLVRVRHILGNFSNHVSATACVMAKHYLNQTHHMREFDSLRKPQGANGLDIDEMTTSGERVIGEIKTTVPIQSGRLGAQQQTSIRKDLARLLQTKADHKYMFVTDGDTFTILETSWREELAGIRLVCLTDVATTWATTTRRC